MKKLMTFLLFGVILTGGLLCQSESSQHFRINGLSNCHYPTLKTDAVIYYEKNVVVHLEFDSDQAARIWQLEKGANDFHEIQLTNGIARLEFPSENKTYEIYGENSCGQQYLLLKVNAQDRQKTGIIEVSKELYEAFGKYLQSGIVPMQDQFYDYIKSLENLSYWERLSFVQQYFLKDKVLKTLQKGYWPSIEKSGGARDGCICEFVQIKTVDLNPGEILFQDGKIIPFKDFIFKPTAYNNRSGYAWWRKNKGPAKGHYLTSGGRHAGGTYREETFNMLIGEDFDVTIDDASPHMAELSYMLACTRNREDVRCDCTKRIIFDYAYETSLTARTKLRGGGIANKRAIAMTQDIAVATLRTDEGIRVLAAGDAREDAACNKERDPDFYSNIGELAITLGTILLNDSVVFPLSQNDLPLIDTLKEELETVLSTPYWIQNNCGGNADAVPRQLIDTFEIVHFSPNERVVFRLNSFSNQLVGGKRGWLSNSDITSDFYITAIVKGNVWQGELDCCTTELGIWLLASCEGVNPEAPQPPPSSTESLQARVGAILGSNGIWEDLETVGGGFDNVVIKTELGVATGKNQRCGYEDDKYERPKRKIKNTDVQLITSDKIKDYLDQLEGNDLTKEVSEGVNESSTSYNLDNISFPYTFMEVYSINGQPIYQGELSNESTLNLNQIITDRNLVGHSGIYVIRLSNDQGDWEVRKLIIVK